MYQTSERTGGGRQIWNAFEQLLTEIVGTLVMEEFSRSYPDEYAYFHEEHSVKLRRFRYREQKYICMKIPTRLIKFFEEQSDTDIREIIANSKFSSKIYIHTDKWRFSYELIQGLFNAPCSEIIALVKNVLLKSEIKGTKNIIMIGTFAESPIFQTIFKQAFQEIKVIIPPFPGSASLQGAVIYGHEQRNTPKYASSRVEKFIEMFKKKSCVRF